MAGPDRDLDAAAQVWLERLTAAPARHEFVDVVDLLALDQGGDPAVVRNGIGLLEATSTTMTDFVGMLEEPGVAQAPPTRRIRCLSLGQMEREPAFDSAGFPQAGPWEEIEFPALGDENAYAIELDRDVAQPVLTRGQG